MALKIDTASILKLAGSAQAMHALLEEDRSLADHFTSTILRRLKQLGEELTGVEALFSIEDGFAPTAGGPHQSALPAGATV